MHINYHREGAPRKALDRLEAEEDFKYLDAKITSSLSGSRLQRGIAKSNFWKLQTIRRSTSLSLHLLSGAESWKFVTIIKNQLNSLATSCNRVMLNIKRNYRIRNDRILDTCKRKNLADLLIERQLQTLSHWLRKDDSSVKKYALYTGKNHV